MVKALPVGYCGSAPLQTCFGAEKPRLRKVQKPAQRAIELSPALCVPSFRGRAVMWGLDISGRRAGRVGVVEEIKAKGGRRKERK